MLFLLDASALINEPNFFFESEHNYVTTTLVADELKSLEVKHLIDNALHQDLLLIQNPKTKTIIKIEQLIKEQGFKPLSKPDISIIALALDLHNSNIDFEVLTDDFSIQNFLQLLKINFSSVIQGEIKKTISFNKICSGCKKKFENSFKKKICPGCGSSIKSTRN